MVENYEIVAYNDSYREQVLSVWEKSVLATHDFLSKEDFREIKKEVESVSFSHFQVYCLTDGNTVLGFVGVAGRKIEMLFLSPDYFGQGLGKALLSFAVTKLKADKLDVNEHNRNALEFYRKFGFEVFERTEKDEQGRCYPLLRMQLSKSLQGAV